MCWCAGAQDGLNTTVGYVSPVASAPGEGLVLRNKMSAKQLVTTPTTATVNNLYQLFTRGGLARRPTAPCFGSRVRDNGQVGAYEWQTYQQVNARINDFAAGLWRCDLVPQSPDGHAFLGFFLKNSRDWMVGALACIRSV